MDAVQFECQPGCTTCCDVKGYVYLSEEDLQRAAQYLGLWPDEFEARYVYRTKHLIRLRKPPGSQCHFLKLSGCSIHPAKPTQCRLYPFWPEYLETASEWKKLSKICPGIDKGPLIQIGSALETASEMKRAYPSMYDPD